MGLMVLSSLVSTTTLSNKLVKECTKTDKKEDKYNSCILYIVLFSIFSTISTGVYFVYYKCMNRNKKCF